MTIKKLNILIVTSEMYPFAKVGGLADVVGSLSAALKARGHDVRVVMPRYGIISLEKSNARPCVEPMGVWMGTIEEWCAVFQSATAASVPVYLVEHKNYFDRPGLYHDGAMHDYADNPLRFAFLCRAALQLCRDISFKPDIVHVNDWQTALTAAYLKIWHWNDPLLGGTSSFLTVHNAAYQGCYPKNTYEYIGLGWGNFTDEKLESYDQINFLKGGIYYADGIAAVSPAFAREIQSPYGAFGLAPYFERRKEDLRGILNGIDYSLWDPATDNKIQVNYSVNDLRGKKTCKKILQDSFKTAGDPHVPVIGAIGRFVGQKGFGLITRCIDRVLTEMQVQFVILGDGTHELEDFFRKLPERFPGRAGSFIGFDEKIEHQVIAGSDFFLMPSQWEPCGLNQMFAQRYGTLPIVRAVGGLDDTVENYDETTGTGTGFKFNDFSEQALYHAIGRAVRTWYDRPGHIQKMLSAAMRRDFSWERSASAYESAYHQAMAHKKRYDSQHKKYYW